MTEIIKLYLESKNFFMFLDFKEAEAKAQEIERRGHRAEVKDLEDNKIIVFELEK